MCTADSHSAACLSGHPPSASLALYPVIPAYNAVVFLFVLANFSMATFMDPGIFPRGESGSGREALPPCTLPPSYRGFLGPKRLARSPPRPARWDQAVTRTAAMAALGSAPHVGPLGLGQCQDAGAGPGRAPRPVFGGPWLSLRRVTGGRCQEPGRGWLGPDAVPGCPRQLRRTRTRRTISGPRCTRRWRSRASRCA